MSSVLVGANTLSFNALPSFSIDAIWIGIGHDTRQQNKTKSP